MTKEEWTAEARRRAEEWVSEFALVLPGNLDTIEARRCVLAGISIGAEMMREMAADKCSDYLNKTPLAKEPLAFYGGARSCAHNLRQHIRALEIPKERET